MVGDLGMTGVEGVEMGLSDGPTPPPRTIFPVLPELVRRTLSRSHLSMDGVGEFRCDAKSSFLRNESRRFRILWMTRKTLV